MSTKGASNRFGNTKHASNNWGSRHIGYQWAKDFNKNSLEKHVKEHMENMGFNSKEEYRVHAVTFANLVDRENHISHIRKNGETVKYSKKTNEFAIIDKKGYVITYYKPRDGINHYYSDRRKRK